ncbi:C-type lectin domain family 4 member K-like isoform X2 [Dromiciops gliroides]|uniref:C-type lectin domain family 4 member K-like isoform X2 n=1 Tax=Dromiciops gliroides TaxID=33562 RepID=UPI001CC3AEFD|nr:C-type lectin domain family 4 member K-like isoform X2 [Dromiciops gliroides]
MDLDGIYENVTQRNELPQAGKGLSHHSYNLGQTSNVGGLQVKNAAMTSEAHMWKAHFERANVSVAALSSQNEILKQQLSEIYTIYKGNLYYFSCTEKPWAVAEEICVSKGSHLTSVTSVDEQEFLYKKANGIRFWNGLSRRKDHMTFHWTDGTLFDDAKTKEFWIPGEPNNRNDNEDCVHFSKKDRKSWNDLNCNSTLKFICKWNCESSELCDSIFGHRS